MINGEMYQLFKHFSLSTAYWFTQMLVIKLLLTPITGLQIPVFVIATAIFFDKNKTSCFNKRPCNIVKNDF